MTERTLILIKPDGVANGHVGEIITTELHRQGRDPAPAVTWPSWVDRAAARAP